MTLNIPNEAEGVDKVDEEEEKTYLERRLRQL
jgi:hypothetical protein